MARWTLSLVPLLTAVLASPCPAQTWQALPNAPSAPQIQDVFFLDEQLGWTSCDETTYRTLDGGATWQSFPAPGVSMRSITFVSPSHGWIGSLNPMMPLWASMDSGKTWSAVPLPEPRPHGICGLWAVNSQVVYGCGRYNGFPRVIKTTDGGETWTCLDLSAYASRLIDCRFTDADSGLVAGGVDTQDGGVVSRILSTADGGETWTVRHTGRWNDSWCWKISFPSRRVGYVSVQTHEGKTHCLKTEDGGESWVELLVSPVAEDTEGIGFATASLGWACGFQIFRTTDGGTTWERDPIGRNINRIRFLSPTLAYASGRTIYKYSLPTSVQPSTVGAIKSRYR